MATVLADRVCTCYGMGMADRTTLFRLVEAKLGESLVDYLRRAREAKMPFHKIAYDLSTRTGEQIVHETARSWVRTLEADGELEASYLPGHKRERPAA